LLKKARHKQQQFLITAKESTPQTATVPDHC